MSTFSKEQINDLLFTERPFSILVDKIWRPAVGVYAEPLKQPFNVKCKLNGKVITLGPNNYKDLTGFSQHDVKYNVIRQNFASLPPPKAPKPKVPTSDRIRQIIEEEARRVQERNV